MVQADPVAARSRPPPRLGADEQAPDLRRRGGDGLELSVTSALAELADEWRAFECHADCTVFQCYDWLAAWQRHIGERTQTTPVIVVGRSRGETQFILPLAVNPRPGYRQLTFLGRDLGDYNAPLVAFDFGKRYGGFSDLWKQLHALLQREPLYRHDVVSFDKMPERIGPQSNPMLQLAVSPHPSSAYRTSLAGDWESFYAAKRSTSTRRRDRSKRKKLAESGDMRMITPISARDIAATTEILMAQKRRALERMGVPDLFVRPGYRDFFLDIATRPSTPPLVHVSRLDVGDQPAAANLGLMFRGSYYHVLASYDDGPLSRFGPGAAHLHDLMRYAIEQGCTEFDFTVGDEPYKRDWCDTELKLYDYISSVGMKGMLIAWPMTAGRMAKRSIKQSALWPFAMKLRAGAAAAVRRLRGG